MHRLHAAVSAGVPTEVRELKQAAGKDIVAMGSSEFAQALMRHDLVDEYRLMVHPVVLGAGKRLFREGFAPSKLRLIEAMTTGGGLSILSYRTAKATIEG